MTQLSTSKETRERWDRDNLHAIPVQEIQSCL